MPNLAIAELALLRKGYKPAYHGDHLTIVVDKVNATVIGLREYLGDGYSITTHGIAIRISVEGPKALRGNRFSRNRAGRTVYLRNN
jgi:hypothetical protein